MLKLFFILMIGLIFVFNAAADTLKLMDFNSGPVNDFGGKMDTWSRDSADATQGCVSTIDVDEKKYGEEGACLKLEYDVFSPNPAYSGFWIKLKGKDLSDYNAVVFWVKGDVAKGWTTRFKVELKNENGEDGRFVVTGLTDEWRRIVVPFAGFKGISDFSSMSEFGIIFDDVLASDKEGAIYIDDIAFSDEHESEYKK